MDKISNYLNSNPTFATAIANFRSNTTTAAAKLSAKDSEDSEQSLPFLFIPAGILTVLMLLGLVAEKCTKKEVSYREEDLIFQQKLADKNKLWTQLELPNHVKTRFNIQESAPYRTKWDAPLYWLVEQKQMNGASIRKAPRLVEPIDLRQSNTGPVGYPREFNMLPEGSVVFPSAGTLEASEYKENGLKATGFIMVFVCTQEGQCFFAVVNKNDMEEYPRESRPQ